MSRNHETIIRYEDTKYSPRECPFCHKIAFLDIRIMPNNGIWSCPYCDFKYMDVRTDNKDVVKKRMATMKKKVLATLDNMEKQIDGTEDQVL